MQNRDYLSVAQCELLVTAGLWFGNTLEWRHCVDGGWRLYCTSSVPTKYSKYYRCWTAGDLWNLVKNPFEHDKSTYVPIIKDNGVVFDDGNDKPITFSSCDFLVDNLFCAYVFLCIVGVVNISHKEVLEQALEREAKNYKKYMKDGRE